MALLLLAAAGLLLWMVFAPGERFLGEFTRLLTDARIRRGPFSLVSGRSYASGSFRGREVAVRLQLKRGRYTQGYMVLAMRTAPQAVPGGEAPGVRTGDGEAERARSLLADHGLQLSAEADWLKALWQPQGFVIFPGRFSPEPWTQVLEAMTALANASASADAVSFHGADGA